MKVIRKIIKIDEELCNGCGNCVPACAEGALEIIDGKARVIADLYCDGLGACLGECPTGALTIVEREADEFDEHAVEQMLGAKQKRSTAAHPAVLPMAGGGCPSARMVQSFGGPAAGAEEPQPAGGPVQTGLSHWPIQIMLVPPTAPFLQGADLLVLADCVAVAFPGLHRDLLKGKRVMMGCPKFDNVQAYVEKFAQVCKLSGIRSITTAVMEVPCCAALPMIVRKGMELSGAKIPMEEVVVSVRGKILERRPVPSA
ncbi:MAG: 4Fe-4S binding protein [Desulfobacterales bacterium]|jgi:NAD-dependent dihydropyrimidine dehydrogenase PreA subunit|nr:4Fe-4S binding protein [Desulfobacterales bacterium]